MERQEIFRRGHRAWRFALFSSVLAVAAAEARELPDGIPVDIDAGVIAAIADGDFVAGSYASGELAPRETGYRDQLLLFRAVKGEAQWESVEVSNSVTAPPEVLRLAPDGRTAFVIERLAQRSGDEKRIAELSPGRRLFAVALPEDAPARLADTLEIGEFPESLDISPDGRHIAVVSNTAKASMLQLVPYTEGRFGTPRTFNLALFVRGAHANRLRASAVAWHPSGRALAVNLNTRDQVLFLELDRSLSPRPWGRPVKVGRDPFVGRFTPDGRHYITADWGRDFAATNLAGRLPEEPSQLSVVRLTDPGAGAHRVVHRAESDISSEGLAVSRDGRLVATVNMRGTVFPQHSPRFHRRASVSLFRFDAGSGALEKMADVPFEGILPEGGSFDFSGRYFLASVFEYRGGSGGGIEVFRVMEEGGGLEHLGRIPLPHGVHHVDVAHR